MLWIIAAVLAITGFAWMKVRRKRKASH